MNRIYAIILAGGRGLRLGGNTPKQFLPLGSKPIIAWSLELCQRLPEIDHIVTVIPDEFAALIDAMVNDHGITKHISAVPGGSTRQESAFHAIRSVNYADDDMLIFHDAARPFVSQEIMLRCIAAIRDYGAAAAYVPIHDTIAEIDHDVVVSVPPRDRLYYAQTPQGFRYSIIKAAHDNACARSLASTDDVSLVLATGATVRMIDGDHSNFKITTDHDYQRACSIAEALHYGSRR